MNDLFNVSSNEFIVRLPKSKKLDEFRLLLSKLGTVEALPALPDHVLLRLQEGVAEVPRKAWESVRKLLGKKEKNVEVSPVLIDADNNPRYSVGSLGVRFKSAPSESELAEFCDSFGLQVKATNPYVPAQTTFEPREARQFLPDLLAKVQKEGDVVAVWPETLSSYKRG